MISTHSILRALTRERMLLLATKACFTTGQLALCNTGAFASRYAVDGDNSALRTGNIIDTKWFKKAYFGTIRSIDEATTGPDVKVPKTFGASDIIEMETGTAETSQATRSTVQQSRQKKYIRKQIVRQTWSAAVDARLTEAVALYKKRGGWKRVAEHVGGGVTWQQCKNRWNNHLGKAQQDGIEQGDWTNEEVRQLEELVPQHVTKPRWNEIFKNYTRECTDWIAIGKVMNRIPFDCKSKWRLLHYSRLKKGPFTPEEDALIIRRVAEWGDKGMGLWSSLQLELGRRATNISSRWNTSLAPQGVVPAPKVGVVTLAPFIPLLLDERHAPYKWKAFMDARLTEGKALYKENGGWKRVAEHVGGEVTWKQCKERWNMYLSKAQHSGINQGAWPYEEVRQLEELVPQHVIKPRWNESHKVMTQERTDWIAIGKLLNRVPTKCKQKWNDLQARRMKKGPFTPEEDAVIVQRVEEWGDQGNGLWVRLQQELGRPSAVIGKRWKNVLDKL